nr:hypothetical protein [Tanacetum cinerariifolium]
MTTLADKAILSGAENRPPMLEKHMYDSCKSIMELYMMNRQYGRMIFESVQNGPLIWPMIEENGVTRPSKYSKLTPAEAIQADCDERECKLYDEFDKFAYKKGETLHDFYLIFSLLLNDMNIYNVKVGQFQVNTKFLNTLPPEWSKFMTDVKLLRNSSNPRQQATINDGRVTLQPVQGRQISFATGTTRFYTPGASGSNSGKQRTVICNNCKWEGHMSKQCTKPKQKHDDSWFKDKVLLNSMNSLDLSPSKRPTKVEVPKELSKVSMCRPMRLESLATWDGVNSTWGGRAKGFGTVPVCMRVQERAGEDGLILTGRHFKLNANFKLICVKCNGCMLSDNHDLYVLNVINDMNARLKSKSMKKNSKRKVRKPTSKVFTKTGYTWRPTGQTFTIVGNVCLLTRITTPTEVPPRKSTVLETDTPKPVVTLVYSRKPRKSKTSISVSKPKIIKSISANNKNPVNLGDL